MPNILQDTVYFRLPAEFQRSSVRNPGYVIIQFMIGVCKALYIQLAKFNIQIKICGKEFVLNNIYDTNTIL